MIWWFDGAVQTPRWLDVGGYSLWEPSAPGSTCVVKGSLASVLVLSDILMPLPRVGQQAPDWARRGEEGGNTYVFVEGGLRPVSLSLGKYGSFCFSAGKAPAKWTFFLHVMINKKG